MKPYILLVLLLSTIGSSGESTRIENRDGRLIDVTILGKKNNAVRVKKADGKEFEILLESLTEESLKRIDQQLKTAAPVDGNIPKIKVQTEAIAPDEALLFTNLYPLLRDWRFATTPKTENEKALGLRAECDTILNSLAQIHGDLSVKDRCERLLAVACGRLKGGSITTQLGAASCLTQIQGPEATACMFEGLNTDVSEAVEIEFQHGLGERCTGKLMDQLLEMFMSSDTKTRSRGGFTLTYISTKAQLAELKERAKTVVNTAEALDRLSAVYSLTRHVND